MTPNAFIKINKMSSKNTLCGKKTIELKPGSLNVTSIHSNQPGSGVNLV